MFTGAALEVIGTDIRGTRTSVKGSAIKNAGFVLAIKAKKTGGIRERDRIGNVSGIASAGFGIRVRDGP